MDRLYDNLIAYQDKDYYPFHMPGHKRNTELLQMINPYAIDITEIKGFDNLHQAEGILKQLSERISRIYGAVKSFPLVNGSTVGILAGISAATNRGDKILLARNCHKSVYHAVVLKGLTPIYLYPPCITGEAVYGGITAGAVEEALIKNPDIALVVITSPTYDGMVSDIRAIAQAVHQRGALLMIDEAHGAHLGLHEAFPESAVKNEADIIIQSLHKTLPAFTQTAVLHSNKPSLNRKLEYYLSIYESSSPSYLLLAGIDRCISIIEDNGKDLFDSYLVRLKEFYDSVRNLKHLKVLEPDFKGEYGVFAMDPSKILVLIKDTKLTGHELYTLIYDRYHLVLELEAPRFVLAMTGICDTKEGFDRLSRALQEIDASLGKEADTEVRKAVNMIHSEQVILPGEAAESETESVFLDNSCDRISAVFVSMFPPGSPILVPGERISGELIRQIEGLWQEGYTITGLDKELKIKIEVIKDR